MTKAHGHLALHDWTARFWVWHRDSWVRLSLAPGQSLSLSWGGPTDEGWHRESERWTHDGEKIVREWREDGCDCDGRLTRGGTLFCPLDQLEARDCGLDGAPMLPEWHTLSSSQRDYSAEAMGY